LNDPNKILRGTCRNIFKKMNYWLLFLSDSGMIPI
jgi:hypothetical protein